MQWFACDAVDRNKESSANATLFQCLGLVCHPLGQGQESLQVLSVPLCRETPPPGASIPPETMMHSPLFQIFPLFPKKIRTFQELFLQFYLFPKHFLIFILF